MFCSFVLLLQTAVIYQVRSFSGQQRASRTVRREQRAFGGVSRQSGHSRLRGSRQEGSRHARQTRTGTGETQRSKAITALLQPRRARLWTAFRRTITIHCNTQRNITSECCWNIRVKTPERFLLSACYSSSLHNKSKTLLYF